MILYVLLVFQFNIKLEFNMPTGASANFSGKPNQSKPNQVLQVGPERWYDMACNRGVIDLRKPYQK